MSNIKLDIDDDDVIDIPINIFPGGEVNINLKHISVADAEVITVYAEIDSSDGVMALLLLKNILDEKVSNLNCLLRVLIPYFPYARQDRVCSEGDAFSIKVMANLINSMNWHEVLITDPHSDVTPALLNNCVVVEQYDIVMICTELQNKISEDQCVLVAPDYGATKKLEKLLTKMEMSEYIQGYKKRDPITGHLSGFGFYGEVEGKNLMIIDDICDGGGTFIGLAQVLKAAGAASVNLYVSHGIFSRGINHLLKDIDDVYTTNTLNSTISHAKLHKQKL